jgi:hypothetical protein
MLDFAHKFQQEFSVMKSFGGYFSAAAAALALALAGPSTAAPIRSIAVGDTTNFTLFFDSPSPALSAIAAVQVYSATNTQLVLRFLVTNDTVVSESGPLTQASLMSIGLDFDPNPANASLLSGLYFDGLNPAPSNFPGGYSVDVCVFAANNCSGGDIKDGLLVQDLVGTDKDIASGAGDTFRLTLTRNAPTSATATPWNLNTAAVKFQTNMGSFEFAGCTNANGCTTTTRVPEPGSIALLGAVAVAFAAAGRRRRKR